MSLFNLGEFKSNSGKILPWKIECDALTDEDWQALAKIVSKQIAFKEVIGVPRGGLKFAEALTPYIIPASNVRLIVDDVLTTGGSMQKMYDSLPYDEHTEIMGIVVFSRMGSLAEAYNATVPDWIFPIFQYQTINSKLMAGLDIDALKFEIQEIVRVARDNPKGLEEFLKLNFPMEWGLSKEEHKKLLEDNGKDAKTND